MNDNDDNQVTWASGTPDMGHAPVLSPHKISFYIDGFNLYYSLLEFCDSWTIVDGKKHKHKTDCNIFTCKASSYKWINIPLLCKKILLNHNFKLDKLDDVNFLKKAMCEYYNLDIDALYKK